MPQSRERKREYKRGKGVPSPPLPSLYQCSCVIPKQIRKKPQNSVIPELDIMQGDKCPTQSENKQPG